MSRDLALSHSSLQKVKKGCEIPNIWLKYFIDYVSRMQVILAKFMVFRWSNAHYILVIVFRFPKHSWVSGSKFYSHILVRKTLNMIAGYDVHVLFVTFLKQMLNSTCLCSIVMVD